MKRFYAKSYLFLFILAIMSSTASPALAVTGSEWRAGRIIDDSFFTSASSMSVSDIQSFLNSKVPECDSDGSEFTNVPNPAGGFYTRAEYGSLKGNPAPYTCLKDYYEVPKTQPGYLLDSWRSHSASHQLVTSSSNSLVAYADINGDGKDEPVLVGMRNTGSGMVEFNVWNSNVQSWSQQVTTTQPAIDPSNTVIDFADLNGDGKDEPVLVGMRNTGSGMVEFHIWENDLKTWRSHISSNQAAIDPASSAIKFGDPSGTGHDQAILQGLNGTGSGMVEFHVWNDGMASWQSHITSNQSGINPADSQIGFADINGTGRDVAVLTGLKNTGSGMLEFHVWNSGMGSWQMHIASSQPVIDPLNSSIAYADLTTDSKDIPTLIGLNHTGSGKIEFHVWEPGVPLSNYGGKPIPTGAKSAAQLISEAAYAYNISPKVILTTIQKESYGPLIIDEWPYAHYYTYALGAQCPDGPNGAQCDEDYAGFSIQVRESAELFRFYLDNMNQSWWPYKKVGVNNVLYNVAGTNCSSSDINIQTSATAALYTYTPYQPNQAALDNLYGTGDGCSAYGNRNFWRIYNDWFGKSVGCGGANLPTHSTVNFQNNRKARTTQPFFTIYSGTTTGCVEFHGWNGSMSSWLSHTASIQPSINPADSKVLSANLSGNQPVSVLVGMRNTGSGMVEFHVWDSSLQRWSAHVASNHPAIDPANTTIDFADLDGDGKDEPVLVNMRNTASGKVEFHIWNSNMRSWKAHVASNYAAIDPANAAIGFADLYGTGHDQAILENLNNTGSGKVEFHVWKPWMQEWQAHIASNHPSIDPLNSQISFGDINGVGKDVGILIGLKNTGSGKVEFHIWNSGMGSWQSNIASNQVSL